MSALLAMSRPQACLAAGAASLLGSHLGGGSLSSAGSWLAALTVVPIVACSNLVNDIVDAEADALNRPERAFATGRAGVRATMVASSLLAVGGLVVAGMLGRSAAVVAGACLAAGVSYSFLLRRVPIFGHVWVAAMFGGTVVWGGWATSEITTAVWMAAVLVALFLLPRELLKSLGDVRGDRASGWRTAAVVWGRRTTLLAISTTSILFALATLAPVFRGVGEGGYLAVIWLGTVIPLVTLIVWLWRNPEGALTRAEFLTGLMWFPGLAALWQLGPG